LYASLVNKTECRESVFTTFVCRVCVPLGSFLLNFVFISLISFHESNKNLTAAVLLLP
jgi:hypothetical protein